MVWPPEGEGGGATARVRHGSRWCGDSGKEKASSGGSCNARGRGDHAGAVCVAGGGLKAVAASGGASGGGGGENREEKKTTVTSTYL
jgi:hypothetical protein